MTSLSAVLGDFINLMFLAHLGTAAITGVAATAIINFFFVSVDKNGLKAVTGRLVGQSTSEELANLPSYLQQVKEEAKENRGMVLVQHITYNSLFSSLLLGLLVGVLAIAFPREILELGGAERAVAVYAAPYFQIIMGCVVFTAIANSLTSTLNGLKETKSVTIAATSVFFVQITLGYLAVNVLDFGLKGVACANVAAIVMQVVILARMLHKKGFSNRLVKLRPDCHFQWGTCKEAWPLIFERLSFQACVAVFWHVLQSHGTEVMASYRIANQITLIPLAFFIGLYPVITPYVSQYYGNKEYRSIRSFTTTILLVGTLCCGIVLMGTYFIGPWVTTQLFTDDKSLLEMTKMWLLFLVFTHVSNTALQIVTYSLKAVGSKNIILISSLASNGAWGVSLYLWGSTGNLMLISSLQVVATIVKMAILCWYFYSRRWEPRDVF
ncbi:MATE family efflux transporter [Shimazuella kribbensis]|uniref:MATE family efflux transporter n=1 Tax=Shimazuella kribbensis TaxID=139808 RepID=UPI0004902376|nr:MATE family efflux transporter [Shimazuella kribbensis]